MFFRLTASAALMAGLMFTPQLRAGEWVAVATTCNPDDGSTGRYQANQGTFSFLGNNVGYLDAKCNVTNPMDNNGGPGWNSMEISYNDPDGSATNAQVTATLIRVDKFTGNSFVIATFDSNTNGPGQQVRTLAFNHAWNFQNNGYFVTVAVRRTTTLVAPRIQRVRLRVAPVG